MTAVIAAGGSRILMLVWRKRYTVRDRAKAAFVTVLIACVSVVCGFSGTSLTYQTAVSPQSGDSGQAVLAQYDRTALLIAKIGETFRACHESDTDGSVICLWAPREILSYVRQYSSEIKLLYGRNMWDNALNAYSYDTYPEEYGRMYKWMELVSEYGEADSEISQESIDGRECVKNAVAAGVNVIVLPGNTLEKTRLEIIGLTGAQEAEIDGYFVYII